MKNKLSDYACLILLVFIICVLLYHAWTCDNILFKIADCFGAALNIITLKDNIIFFYKNWKAVRFIQNIIDNELDFPQNDFSDMLRKNKLYNSNIEEVNKGEENIRDDRQND